MSQDEKAVALREVVTTQEVHQTYGVHTVTVIEAIKMGWILGRKSGRTWLLLSEDAEARWGYLRVPAPKD